MDLLPIVFYDKGNDLCNKSFVEKNYIIIGLVVNVDIN